jgi:hypothetical protein
MHIRQIMATFLFVLTMTSSAWCGPATVFVNAFTVRGAEKPDEVKTTIQTLLLSRLSDSQVTAVDKPAGASISVSGSYFSAGKVFSLDAVAVNGSGDTIVRAYAQGNSPDDLIPAVNELAKKLSTGIENALSAGATPQAATLPAQPAQQPAQQPAPAVPAASQTFVPSGVVVPAPVAHPKNQAAFAMPGALNGLAIGGTLADGTREIFAVGRNKLRYYRQGAELKLVKEITFKSYEQILSVDSFERDGHQEIYLTMVNNDAPASQVWTVEANQLKQIAGPLPYFFRAVTAPQGKKIFAQRVSEKGRFVGEVAELIKTGNGYTLGTPITLPKDGNVDNFAFLKGPNGETTLVTVGRGGNLQVYDRSGEVGWKSDTEFGGSENFFLRNDRNDPFADDQGNVKVYLDQRLIVTPSGKLLVSKNSAPWILASKHTYLNSNVYCFAWDGNNLDEKWHTTLDDNYLSDFAFDGKSGELVLLEVTSKEQGVFFTGKSKLVVKKVE